jgi:hypothetical protein
MAGTMTHHKPRKMAELRHKTYEVLEEGMAGKFAGIAVPAYAAMAFWRLTPPWPSSG